LAEQVAQVMPSTTSRVSSVRDRYPALVTDAAIWAASAGAP